MPTSVHNKQIQALTLAIGALHREKRRLYAAGNAAYTRSGVRTEKFDVGGIKGENGSWAEKDHQSYIQYEQTIQELQDLIDILSDHGVTREQEMLL